MGNEADNQAGDSAGTVTSETIELLRRHTSVRQYQDRPVSEAQLAAIVGAAQMASTSSNVQAYSVIAVRDAALKQQLSALSGNQAYIEQCPVFLVWCADLYRLRGAAAAHGDGGETYEDTTEQLLVATIDAALAAQNAAVAAESLGLGIVYIGGVRNNSAELSQLLGLPELVYPVFGMCLGYPAGVNGLRPRLPLKAVLHHERYDAAAQPEQVALYDDAYTAYMHERTGGKQAVAWSATMAQRLAQPVRLHMQDFLRARGFMRR
ncbi:oxygen-insensitive NADPH nitroreductase [Paenibacillus sp. NFR01]|uniref:oxygen-insensitive NADPH nitroreductase n=1 Tax=Paenibacillus sp. NFR01 TaxID=1566279 RepID=UPI0008D583E7|nr:oxygen-insensitive NADPH nitroreductase [Paenibacillus sp. NFR01]SEU24007.1 FMN reductase (NADPH) [Paenibacillus sp. NFR01]